MKGMVQKGCRRGRMKYLALTMLLLIAASIFLIWTEEDQTPKAEPIKINLNVWPGYAYAYIAQEKGYFKNNGADVQLILHRNMEESREAFKEGSADGLFTTLSDAIMMKSQGIDETAVLIVDYSTEGDVIIGRQVIANITGLRNKTIGIEGINTFSHMFIIETLRKAGVQENEIFLEKVKAHDILNALETGKIDAGHTREPTKSAAQKKGYKILAKAGDNLGSITDLLIFDSEILKEKPDKITAIIRSLEQARQFAMANRKEAVSIMANAESISDEAMARGIDGLGWVSLSENAYLMSGQDRRLEQLVTETAEFWANRGQLPSIPMPSDIIDPRFAAEAYRTFPTRANR